LTAHEEFKDNMLSANVLKIDVSRYLEENWPIDDKDLDKLHKQYRLVAYKSVGFFKSWEKRNANPSQLVYTRLYGRNSHHSENILILIIDITSLIIN
jgi:hypothetical protein